MFIYLPCQMAGSCYTIESPNASTDGLYIKITDGVYLINALKVRKYSLMPS